MKLQRRLFQGTIIPETDDDCRLGSPDRGFKYMYFALPSTSPFVTSRTYFSGLIWADDTQGDLYVGQEPENYGFYIQKATKANDASSVATNLFQGQWGGGATPSYPAIEINWLIGDGNTWNYGGGDDQLSYLRRGMTTVGAYVSGVGGGGGLFMGARLNGTAGTYLVHDEASNRFCIRTLSGSSTKSALWVSSIGLGGLRVSDVVPLYNDQIDLGSSSLGWKDLYLTGSAGFHGTTPPAQPSAYTQTYSTATRTHANPTAATLTDSSGGTASQTLAAITGGGSNCENATKDAIASLADEVNKLIADVANVKQIANSLIDDGQTYGLLQ